MHQRNAQRHPDLGQREIITGSFDNRQDILDFANCRIMGSQGAQRYSREVDIGDDHGVGQRVGAAGHLHAAAQVVLPPGTTKAIPGDRPRGKWHEIKVEVTNSDLTARTKPGYFAR